jgi:multimeric flavodoxin WrbA
MRELYPRLRKCDALVLATPIYFFTMSAQMKVFIDKTYPLSRPKGSEVGAKRAVVCLTYGADDILDSGCVNAVHTFGDIFNYMGIRASYVHASAWKKGDILKNRAALRQAFERGKEAVRGLAGR